MMTKVQYYALLIGLLFFTILGFQSAYVDLIVSCKGEKIKAVVKQVNCNLRNSNLYLEHNSNEHSVLISLGDCERSKYQVGDTIIVEALPQFRSAQLPGENQYWDGVLLGLFSLILFIYSLSKKSECLPDTSGEKTTTKKDASTS